MPLSPTPSIRFGWISRKSDPSDPTQPLILTLSDSHQEGPAAKLLKGKSVPNGFYKDQTDTQITAHWNGKQVEIALDGDTPRPLTFKEMWAFTSLVINSNAEDRTCYLPPWLFTALDGFKDKVTSRAGRKLFEKLADLLDFAFNTKQSCDVTLAEDLDSLLAPAYNCISIDWPKVPDSEAHLT